MAVMAEGVTVTGGAPIPATVAPQGWLTENQGDLALLELYSDPPREARPARHSP